MASIASGNDAHDAALGEGYPNDTIASPQDIHSDRIANGPSENTPFRHEDPRLEQNPVKRSGPGRKSRACLECKRQKMRCEILPGSRKCKHCLRKNTECSLRFMKLPVTFHEGHQSSSTTRDIERYERKIDSLHNDVSHLKRTLDCLVGQGCTIVAMGPSNNRTKDARIESDSTPFSYAAYTKVSDISARGDNMQMAMTRENSIEPGGPSREGNQTGAMTVDEPMSSLYEVTRLRNIRSNQGRTTRPVVEGGNDINDFISRGVISEGEAQELYHIFHNSLNHYLWVGLEQIHDSLISVRRSSELLTATILTVTALHNPTSAETFDNCYREFLSLVSSSMFSRYHSTDDVRALCIAAFWLSEVSWKLAGHAIRIATELNIHQSFHKALIGDKEHFLKARLWYMLYVCDHHFSIAYGRPPMISESLQIREHELFLQIPLADALDLRILSQVSLMHILTRVYDRFVEQRLPRNMVSGVALLEEDLPDMRQFNLEIDKWRMTWQPRQKANDHIGTFPPKGNILYSYFAKLQLNSLAVRGVSLSQGSISTERKEFANMAISAAASILTFILEEEDMRRALVGTPLYVHTMIAFASVFLMKVTTKWNRITGLNVEREYVSALLQRMIELLRGTITSDRHLLPHLAAGLEKMLSRSQAYSPGIERVEQLRGGDLWTGYLPDQAEGQIQYHQSHNNDRSIADAGLPSTAYGDWEQFGDPTDTDMTIMNDGWIYEAFGSDSANDVYNLLTSQFSY